MVAHVVMWRVKGEDAGARAEACAEIKASILKLEGKIPGLLSLEVGLNQVEHPGSYDLVLISRHESWEALDAYRVHPEHLKVAEVVGRHSKERAAVDFEV